MLVRLTKVEKLSFDNMMGFIGSMHNRCWKCCSSHLVSRRKSRLVEGKDKLLFEVGV